MPVRILSSADQRWVNLEGIRNQQKYAHMFLSSAGVASQAVLQLLTAKGTYLSLGKSVAFRRAQSKRQPGPATIMASRSLGASEEPR